MGFLFPNPLHLSGFYRTWRSAGNCAAGGFRGQTGELLKQDFGQMRADGDEANDPAGADTRAARSRSGPRGEPTETEQTREGEPTCRDHELSGALGG